jgi:hypothetical protein
MSLAGNTDSNWRLAVLAGAAGLLAVAAVTVRMIGIALFPPLVFLMVTSPWSESLMKRLSIKTKMVIVAGGALAGGVAMLLLTKTAYWQFYTGVAKKVNISALLLQILSDRLVEFGELFGNFPTSKLSPRLHFMVPWMGLLLLLLILLGLATKRSKVSPTELFLVCYMGILFVWPCYDARYWLPVLPLLIAYTVLAVKSLRFPKVVTAIYCIAYATLGFGAIAYSSRITFAGSKFPEKYGDGNLRPTYCVALQSCPDGVDPNKVDAKALHLLREYR